MGTFIINGGKSRKGEIIPQGAKNEALQIICAVLLTNQTVRINRIPDIRDVNKLIELLIDLGVKVKKVSDETFDFTADNINIEYLNSAEFKAKGASLRGSIMIVGP